MAQGPMNPVKHCIEVFPYSVVHRRVHARCRKCEICEGQQPSRLLSLPGSSYIPTREWELKRFFVTGCCRNNLGISLSFFSVTCYRTVQKSSKCNVLHGLRGRLRESPAGKSRVKRNGWFLYGVGNEELFCAVSWLWQYMRLSA